MGHFGGDLHVANESNFSSLLRCNFSSYLFPYDRAVGTFLDWGGGGGGRKRGGGRTRATPGEEVVGSIPAVVARSLLVGSVSV